MKPANNTPGAATPSNRAEPALAMRGVGMLFDSYQARVLTDVNLEVRPGEVLGLLGPDGAGKSTLLRIVAAQLRPSEGSVKVFGRTPRRAAADGRIGYLPQTTGDARDSGTARWLGAFGIRLAPPKRAKRGALPEAATASARLQQAVLGNRNLLVLDEPFAALDAVGRREAAELIRTLAQRGKAIMLSGTSLADAEGVCDRLAMIYGGRIQAVGTLAELLATAEGIRVLAPVLTPAAGERVLESLRRELLSGSSAVAAHPIEAIIP